VVRAEEIYEKLIPKLATAGVQKSTRSQFSAGDSHGKLVVEELEVIL
jgi:hypothetical protein